MTNRQAAVEETVARLNAERAALGMPQDYIVGSSGGVPFVAVAGATARQTPERVRLSPAPKTKRERL